MPVPHSLRPLGWMIGWVLLTGCATESHVTFRGTAKNVGGSGALPAEIYMPFHGDSMNSGKFFIFSLSSQITDSTRWLILTCPSLKPGQTFRQTNGPMSSAAWLAQGNAKMIEDRTRNGLQLGTDPPPPVPERLHGSFMVRWHNPRSFVVRVDLETADHRGALTGDFVGYSKLDANQLWVGPAMLLFPGAAMKAPAPK